MIVEIPLWRRPAYHPCGSRASISLFAFSEAPLTPDVPFSLSRFGAPSADSVSCLNVQTHAEADDPKWFDGWRTGALRTIAVTDLADAARLDAARYCHSIVAEIDDPPDLGYLQAAWAVARWLADRGCFALVDVHAGRWLDGSKLAALIPERPFNLDAEVRFVFETDPTPGWDSGNFGHAMHTRGMAKFGRPDVITGLALPDMVEFLEQVLRQVAQALADGASVSPGQGINIAGKRAFALVPYQPGVNAPQVHLNNEGMLIVPA